MSGWVVFNYLRVHDEDRILEYRRLAHPTVAEHGGSVRIRPTGVEMLEGPASAFLIVVEFESLERARSWYSSAAYQEAKAVRDGAADVQVMLAEGPDAPAP